MMGRDWGDHKDQLIDSFVDHEARKPPLEVQEFIPLPPPHSHFSQHAFRNIYETEQFINVLFYHWGDHKICGIAHSLHNVQSSICHLPCTENLYRKIFQKLFINKLYYRLPQCITYAYHVAHFRDFF